MQWEQIQRQYTDAAEGCVDGLEAVLERLPISSTIAMPLPELVSMVEAAAQTVEVAAESVGGLAAEGVKEAGIRAAELSSIVQQELALLKECQAHLRDMQDLEIEERSLLAQVSQVSRHSMQHKSDYMEELGFESAESV
mmetsp:Transcript_24969/g.47422  ORF Transcript_24969/g.47422 Transcript_24969/m.47422 type:complete len:139 (+) Transcript_24969:129-545(+)